MSWFTVWLRVRQARDIVQMDRNGVGVEFDLRKLKGNIMSNANSHISSTPGNGQGDENNKVRGKTSLQLI